jgi:hypothetical protein
MSYTIYRIDHDGNRQVVSCTDDLCEVGCIIEEDRGNLDWEPEYFIENDKKGADK